MIRVALKQSDLHGSLGQDPEVAIAVSVYGIMVIRLGLISLPSLL